MDSNDVFSKPDNTDPFADSDFGDWEPEGGRDPSEGQTPTPVEPLAPEPVAPTPVEPDGTTGSTTDASPVPEAPPVAPESAPPAPQGAAAPVPVPSPPPPPPSPSQAASAPESVPPPAPQAVSAAPDAPPAPQAVSDAPPAPQAPEAPPEEEPPSAASNGASPPGVEAELPEETKDKRGRVTHRRYVILRADGGNRYTQLDWYEDRQHKLVSKTTSGAKRQNVVLARGTEEALKFGYAVVDSPPKGAPLVAVAAAYFQVRHVAPEPPEPMRQKLKIT